MQKRVGLMAALVAATGYLTAADAAPIFEGATTLVQVKHSSDTVARTTSATSYVDFTSLGVVIPTGQTRLITARFTAESQCTRAGTTQGGWCTVQIQAKKRGTTTVVNLNPASGFDYAFDSDTVGTGADDMWESNTIERSKRLPVGTWDITVQWAVVGTGLTFRLDDWHYRIEVMQ